VNYGFGPVFLGVIVSYVVAIFLYWRFFWDEPTEAPGTPTNVAVIGSVPEGPYDAPPEPPSR
jgi:hypothetical protein